MRFTRRALIAGLGVASAMSSLRAKRAYGPMRRRMLGQNDRAIEVWVWPALGTRKGRIHFSHGNFSAPIKYARLLEAWAADGWEIFAPLHVDSTDHPDTKSYTPPQSWSTRLEDMALLSAEAGKQSYVAAGHSYGGLIALVLGGAKPLLPGAAKDAKVTAVVALSPPGAMPGLIDAKGFATLSVPALIQTGNKDVFPGQPADAWRAHLKAFEAPRAKGKLLALTLEGVDHYFGGIICRPELPGPKQEAGFAKLQSVSGLFLDGNGLRIASARAALAKTAKSRGSDLQRR